MRREYLIVRACECCISALCRGLCSPNAGHCPLLCHCTVSNPPLRGGEGVWVSDVTDSVPHTVSIAPGLTSHGVVHTHYVTHWCTAAPVQRSAYSIRVGGMKISVWPNDVRYAYTKIAPSVCRSPLPSKEDMRLRARSGVRWMPITESLHGSPGMINSVGDYMKTIR